MALNTLPGGRDLQQASIHASIQPSMSTEPTAVLLKDEIWHTYQSFCKELSRGYDPVKSIEEMVDVIRDDVGRVDTWLDKLLSANPNQPWWAHNHEAETLDNAVNSLQADVEKEIEDDTIREVKGLVDLIMNRAKATL